MLVHSAIKLNRTDTTLDLSHYGREVKIVYNLQVEFIGAFAGCGYGSTVVYNFSRQSSCLKLCCYGYDQNQLESCPDLFLLLWLHYVTASNIINQHIVKIQGI